MSPRRWIALFLVVAALAGAVRAARASHVPGDFLRYHRAARLVTTGDADHIYDRTWLQEGRVYAIERREEAAAKGPRADEFTEREFKYAPALAVLMAPLGAMHPRTAWTLWGAWNGTMVAAIFTISWMHARRGVSNWWALVPVAVLAHAVNDNLNLGQLNPTAIAATMAAFLLLDRGRAAESGALAAAGTVVKYLPGLLAIWFVVRRAWTALAVFAAATVALGVALPAIVLGPARSFDLAAEWWEVRHRIYTGDPVGDLPGHSVKSFVHRVFGGTHYESGSGADAIDWDVSVVHADPAVLRWVVIGVVSLILAAVLLAARRAGDEKPLAAGMFVAFMVLASPEARSPHCLYLALPLCALASALVRAWRERRPGCAGATACCATAAVLINTPSESVFGRPLANTFAAYCAIGWATVLLLVASWLLIRSAAQSPGTRGPNSHSTRCARAPKLQTPGNLRA